MNIRMPGSMAEDVVRVQDEFLTVEAEEKGIIDLSGIPTAAEQYGSRHPFADKISIWQGDITRLHVGAIVNAANCQMLGCFVPATDVSIMPSTVRRESSSEKSAAATWTGEKCSTGAGTKSRPAGSPDRGIQSSGRACDPYGGPIVGGRLTRKHRVELRSCYENVMRCCVAHKIRSVAFCCISTGEFHFPNDEAAKIAVETVTEFLEDHEAEFDRVIFNVFKDLDRELYEEELSKCNI